MRQGSRTKARKVSTATPSIADLRKRLDARSRELKEAREQQTATAEVLQIINSSPGDLTPVWDAMLEKALSLCEANFGLLCSFDGEAQILLASRGMSPELVEMAGRVPIEPTSSVGRLARNKDHFIHIPDITDDPVYRSGVPSRRLFVEATGARTALWVALRKDGVLIGVFIVYRTDVRPFADKQIALLQSFAAQAVVAMENARLITETREALEQQTATAEVLGVINSSPGDLRPVFETMLEKAMQLCEAHFGAFFSFDGEVFHLAAERGSPAAGVAALREPLPGKGALEELIKGEDIVHVPDVADSEAYRGGVRGRRLLVDLFGARTALWVALRRDEALFGYFCIYRKEVRPFTEKQIALLQNFAAQAVIAMENTRLLAETREALRAQQATAEVMQVINASSGDLAPVFQAMLDKAMALCGAEIGGLGTWWGDRFSFVAALGVSKPFTDFIANNEVSPGPRSAFLQVARDKGYVQFEDLAASPLYAAGDPLSRAVVDLDGGRTTLTVPLVRDDEVLGVICAVRRDVRPFSEGQIALLKNFAGQAVVAMENARLLTETREALEQQTATAEILGVINSSPGNLAPVFDAMLEKAMRLCEASFGGFVRYDGDLFRMAAQRNMPQSAIEAVRQGLPAVPGGSLIQLVLGEPIVHLADIAETEGYRSGNRGYRALVDEGGAHTAIWIALRQNQTLLGAFVIYRQEVRPFTDKQIVLLKNFAAQAVIAIENARLLTETREALEKQTATAEILSVISSSPTDVQPTFEAIAARAAILCGATSAAVFRFDGALIHYGAMCGMTEAEREPIREVFPLPPGRSSATTRAIESREIVHIPDTRADPEYVIGLRAFGTALSVPMLRDGVPMGAITVTRLHVEPFSDAQIELLKTFADQAVIAIETVRLFTELNQRTRDLQEALEYQTATSDVLQVISRSTFDLHPVLNTLLQTAARLCNSDSGGVTVKDGDTFRYAAIYGVSDELTDVLRQRPLVPGRDTVAGRAALEGRVVHLADLAADPSYGWGEVAASNEIRSVIGVPLLRGTEAIGTFSLARNHVEPFNDRQIELVRTFADQAVIAIENVRLFNEVQERTRELSKSLGDLRAAQDRLIQTEKLASLGQLTAGIAHEIKNPLNFVNNFSALSVELTDELNDLLKQATLADKLRGEVDELTTLLKDNLGKVVQHGKRANSIVKNMLLHSREGTGERRSADINALVGESLNLAYHGARAEKAGFSITLKHDFDPAAGLIDLHPQEITRALLNLISNGFYAATKRKAEAGDESFEPVLSATTRNLGKSVEIRFAITAPASRLT